MSSDAPTRSEPDVLPPSRPTSVGRPDATRRGGGPALSIDLDVRTEPEGQILVLRFAGEIDIATLPAVRDALAAARNAVSCDVVVDLTALAFCCARGFALLVEAAEHAASAGTGFAVSGLDPHFDRVTDLVWPDGAVASHPTAAAAVGALRADRAARSHSRP